MTTKYTLPFIAIPESLEIISARPLATFDTKLGQKAPEKAYRVLKVELTKAQFGKYHYTVVMDGADLDDVFTQLQHLQFA